MIVSTAVLYVGLKSTNPMRKYVSLILRLTNLMFKFGKAVELRFFFISIFSFADFVLSVLLAVKLSFLKAYLSIHPENRFSGHQKLIQCCRSRICFLK